MKLIQNSDSFFRHAVTGNDKMNTLGMLSFLICLGYKMYSVHKIINLYVYDDNFRQTFDIDSTKISCLMILLTYFFVTKNVDLRLGLLCSDSL